MAKKIPMRMCVSCRERFPKKELNRIVASPDGEVKVDPTGRMPGRGAYVCSNPDCLQKAIKQHRFDSGLHRKVEEEQVISLLEKNEEGGDA